MPRPCEVYTKELASLFRGHAVLNPRRARLQSGVGLRPAINVGDVAYDYNGQIIRLFNCLSPPHEQDDDCVFPDEFEVLQVAAQTRSVASRTSSVTVLESHARTGPYYSKGVQALKVEAGASVSPAGCGASIAFAAREEQGAVLLTSNRVKTRISPNRPAFEKYMVKHFDSWCSLLDVLELDVKPEDLMFITAVDMTQAWSNLVYSERELRGEFRVEVPSVCGIGGHVGAGLEFSHVQSATRDSGPHAEDLEEDGSEADYVSVPSLGSTPDDQTIFVRALRGKKRKFMGMKIVANAVPNDLTDYQDFDEDDEDSAVRLRGSGELLPYEDYLTPVLDMVLENTDVDLAVVHDDDYRLYLQDIRNPFRAPADFVQSRTIDGVSYGTLNMQAPEPFNPESVLPEKESTLNTCMSASSRSATLPSVVDVSDVHETTPSGNIPVTPTTKNLGRAFEDKTKQFERDQQVISRVIDRSRNALDSIRGLAQKIEENASSNDNHSMSEVEGLLSGFVVDDAHRYLNALDDMIARMAAIVTRVVGHMELQGMGGQVTLGDATMPCGPPVDGITRGTGKQSANEQVTTSQEHWDSASRGSLSDTSDSYETDYSDDYNESLFGEQENGCSLRRLLREGDSHIQVTAMEAQHQRDLFDKLPKPSYSAVNRTQPSFLSQILSGSPANTPLNHSPRSSSSGDLQRHSLRSTPLPPSSRSMTAVPMLSNVSAEAISPVVHDSTGSIPCKRSNDQLDVADRDRGSPQSPAHQKLVELADQVRLRRHSEPLDQDRTRLSSATQHPVSSDATTPIPLQGPRGIPTLPSILTPRTTRRQMLSTELSESLRRNLLWERQVSKLNLIRRPTPIAGPHASRRDSELEKGYLENHTATNVRPYSWADDCHSTD